MRPSWTHGKLSQIFTTPSMSPSITRLSLLKNCSSFLNPRLSRSRSWFILTSPLGERRKQSKVWSSEDWSLTLHSTNRSSSTSFRTHASLTRTSLGPSRSGSRLTRSTSMIKLSWLLLSKTLALEWQGKRRRDLDGCLETWEVEKVAWM